jgi:hypothetical protein
MVMVKALIIGTSLPDSLLSLVIALKFDDVNPAPDMTKRDTAPKLITRRSWPCDALINSKRIVDKKHHQPNGTQLLYVAGTCPCHTQAVCG